jgi:hypothetical protein
MFCAGSGGLTQHQKGHFVVLVALLLGIPIGVAGGRWAWSLVASGIGSVSPPVVPTLAIGFVILAALLLACHRGVAGVDGGSGSAGSRDAQRVDRANRWGPTYGLHQTQTQAPVTMRAWPPLSATRLPEVEGRALPAVTGAGSDEIDHILR